MGEGSAKRVLVVDDEKVIREFLTRLLHFEHLTVESAESADEALSFVRVNKFDVVFLDVRMPKMTGLELLRELKKILPDALYIMMTGYAVDDVLEQAKSEGALLAIRKPFEISQIMEIIQNKIKSVK